MVRVPIQVNDKFHKRIKKLQSDIMRKEGKFKSLQQITEEFLSLPEWEQLEKKMVNEIKEDIIGIKFDGRIG